MRERLGAAKKFGMYVDGNSRRHRLIPGDEFWKGSSTLVHYSGPPLPGRRLVANSPFTSLMLTGDARRRLPRHWPLDLLSPAARPDVGPPSFSWAMARVWGTMYIRETGEKGLLVTLSASHVAARTAMLPCCLPCRAICDRIPKDSRYAICP